MKLLTTVAKNLKLLFRNKESAYTIVFGPLLIILVVSFAFMGAGDEYAVSVGVHEAEHTALTQRTIGTLTARGYAVSVYPDTDACIASVQEGVTHACMDFGAAPEGASVPVTFHIDKSRINLVYQVLDDLSSELGLQEDEIREQLSSNALVRMDTAAKLVDESANLTAGIAERLDLISARLRETRETLDGIPKEQINITDIGPLKGYQLGLAQNVKLVRDDALASFEETADLLTEIEAACDNCSEATRDRIDELRIALDDAEERILQISDDVTPKQLEEAQLILRFAIEDLENIQGAIANASSAGATIQVGFTEAVDAAAQSESDIAAVNARLAYTSEFLRQERTDPKVFSSPITMTVESVTASESTLSFAYPYLLVLVIMFIGMLLSSTLIVSDKTSRAAFRNFTTPTSDLYHVMVAFLTAFCILLAEVIVILVVSGPFVAQPLLLNPAATFLIVCVAIVIFTFLGMIIGYLSRTQEAAMITSISIGSVLLFVSNLVIPVEGMAWFARAIGGFNPYIVLSELLKRSMLYGVTTAQVVRDMLALTAFVVMLIIVTVIIQRHLRKRYFRQEEALLPRHVPQPLVIVGRAVHNEVDLMDALDRLTRQEFETLPQELIPGWVEKELRNRKLARQLRGKSKERMILRLDKYLEKHGKRIKQ